MICDLGRIRYVLRRKPYQYKDFFTTNFAFICRDQSYTRKGEFKRYRVSEEKLANVKNEVLKKYFSRVHEIIRVFFDAPLPKARSTPMFADTENIIPSKIKYDLVVTSPPYGDSSTTVAYGQYSSFGSEWISGLNSFNEECNYSNGYQVDKSGLGKLGNVNVELKNHELLMRTIDDIKSVDSKRGDEVLYFFNGYYNAVKNVVTNLNENGRVCFVVGNRTVKGCQIPMDQITSSFFASLGLKFDSILVRDIHNKVMPLKNSPSNKAGAKSGTMMNEFIVNFYKGKP